MRQTRLTLGLWIRMLVASAIAAVTLLAVIVAEFLFVLLLLTLLYAAVFVVTALFLSWVPAVGLVVAFACYFGLLFVGYHAVRVTSSDDLENRRDVVVAEINATLASIRDRLGLPGAILAGVGGGLALFLGGFRLGREIGIEAYFLPLPALVSLFVVGTHLERTVRSELAGDGAVLRTLDDTVSLSDDVDRDPELADIRRRVDRLARQADVPSPDVKIAVTRTPTALTVGYRPAESTVVLSRGLVEELGEREREAVLAHELAHVANQDAAIMSVLSIPAAKAERFVERYHDGFLGLFVLLLWGLSRWAVIVVARYREYVADDGAVAITGDPAALASALETLDRSVAQRPTTDLRRHRTAAAFSIVPPPWEEHRFFDRSRRFVARRLLGTHPPTKKRIERLRFETPDSAATGD